MRLFDTHCHFETTDPAEISAILGRAKAAGVESLMAVGGSLALNASAVAAAALSEGRRKKEEVRSKEGDAFPKVLCAVGLDRDQANSNSPTHPLLHSSTPPLPHSPTFELSNSQTLELPLSAWGEIGLDYHYSPETRDAQLKLFAEQLEEAKRRDLPVVIYTREADEDTIAVLREIPSRGIIHCFTGTPGAARRFLDLGFYISISGIVTFRAADNVRESALVVPDDRILIETDSPFLAPVPLRGKPNEPAFVRYVCEFLAKLRGMAADDFAELTFANAMSVLGNG